MSAFANHDGLDAERTLPDAGRGAGRQPGPRAVLHLTDGTSVPLLAAVVLGREPSRPDHVPVRLHDPSFSASRNHVALIQRDDMVEITDLASTNGTAISFGTGAVHLRPLEPTLVTLPCTILCGDCSGEISFSS